MTISAPVLANAADWQLNGDAAYSGSTDLLLQPLGGSTHRGNAVFKTVVTADGLAIAFQIEASGGSGADGFAFSLFDPAFTTSTSIGGSGGGLGVDTVRGVHVCYSTYNGQAFIEVTNGSGTVDSNVIGISSPRGTHDMVLYLQRTAANTHNLWLTRDGTAIYSALSLPITDTVRLAFSAAEGGSTDNHYLRNFSQTTVATLSSGSTMAAAANVPRVATATLAQPSLLTGGAVAGFATLTSGSTMTATPVTDPYALAVLRSGPSGYWRLTESGPVYRDMSGNGRDFTLAAGSQVPTVVPGPVGAAQSWASGPGYAESLTFFNPVGGSSEVWVFLPGYPSAFVTPLGQANSAGYGTAGRQGPFVTINAAGDPVVVDAFAGVASPSPLPLRGWHHLVSTISTGSPQTTKIYVDGRVVLTTTNLQDFNGDSNWAAYLRGAGSGYSGTDPIIIAEPAIYPRELSAAEVLAHYQAAPTLVPLSSISSMPVAAQTAPPGGAILASVSTMGATTTVAVTETVATPTTVWQYGSGTYVNVAHTTTPVLSLSGNPTYAVKAGDTLLACFGLNNTSIGPIESVTGFGATWLRLASSLTQEVWAATVPVDLPNSDTLSVATTGSGTYVDAGLRNLRGFRSADQILGGTPQIQQTQTMATADVVTVTTTSPGDQVLFFSHSLFFYPNPSMSVFADFFSFSYGSYQVANLAFPVVAGPVTATYNAPGGTFGTIALTLLAAHPVLFSASSLPTSGVVAALPTAALSSASTLGLPGATTIALIPLSSTSTLGADAVSTALAAAALSSTSQMPVPLPPVFLSAATSNTQTVTAPASIVAGNLLVAVLFSSQVSGAPFTVTLPDGWTWALSPQRSPVSGAVAVAWRYASASEPVSYTFATSATGLSIIVAQYDNPTPSNPVEAISPLSFTGASSVAVPTLTSTGADALLVAVGSEGALTYTAPGSLAARAGTAALHLLDQTVQAGATPALSLTPSAADSGTVVALLLRGGDGVTLATTGAVVLLSTSALGAAFSVLGAASLSTGSTLTTAADTAIAGQAVLTTGSTLTPAAVLTVGTAVALQTFSTLIEQAAAVKNAAVALSTASSLVTEGGTGQASAALLSISTLGAAGTTVRPVAVVLRSTSALGVTAGVPPTGAAALHSVSALGALGTIAGQVTGLSATWTVAPLSISQDDTQSSNSLAGGNPATGGALSLKVVITAASLEQAILPDWLPGTYTPGTLIDPGGPGVAPTYTDPVFIPEDFGVIVNPPGVPPALVPLGSQFVPLKQVSAIYPVPTLDSRGRPIDWEPSNVIVNDIGWYQVIVAHHDCTVIAGVPVQIGSIVKHEPFGYATATLSWPGVSGFQRIGRGAAAPLNLFTAGAPVEIRIINPLVSTTAYHTVFEGELSSLDDNNDNKTDPMAWTLIGVLFRADLQLEAPRIVPITTLDVGTAIPRLLNAVVNRTYATVAKVLTGIPSYRRGSWQPVLTGAVQDMLSTATTNDGLSQWTVMTLPGRRVRVQVKDHTTISWTVRWGQRGVITRLRLDPTQFANSIYGEGTDPKGLIWRNSKYPALHIALVPAYPLSPSQVFLPGSSTTGFQPLADFMRRHGYSTMISQNTYLVEDEDEVMRFQQGAQILVDGIVGPQTWVAAFGIGTDAESLSGARIDPLIISPSVEMYTYGVNGSITGLNPNRVPTALRVDRFEEFGEGVYKIDGIRSARAEYARDHVPSYVGSIELSIDPNQGSRRFIEAGQNILLQNHRGVDRKLHIAGVTINEAGNAPAVVTLDVAEQPIDRLTLAAIMSRNKDNTDPARRRLLTQRTSRTFNDQIVAWDSESGAGIVPPFPVFGGLWTVVRIPAGGYATIVETIFHTRDVASEYTVGIFSQKVTAAQLTAIVGNPLTNSTGTSAWVTGSTALLNLGWVIGWGDNSQPMGYSPNAKGNAGAVLNGDFIDKGSWEFQSTSEPWMWIAVLARQSCIFNGQLRAAILQ